MNKKIIVVDIDGTIANCDHRKYYLKNGKLDWDKFYQNIEQDEPIEPIVNLVTLLSKKYFIVFCTGRDEKYRRETSNWINNVFGIFSNIVLENSILLMRKENDSREDSIIKLELLKEKNIYPKIVEFILEDRNSVVKMWRDNGFTCLQVAEGNF